MRLFSTVVALTVVAAVAGAPAAIARPAAPSTLTPTNHEDNYLFKNVARGLCLTARDNGSVAAGECDPKALNDLWSAQAWFNTDGSDSPQEEEPTLMIGPRSIDKLHHSDYNACLDNDAQGYVYTNECNPGNDHHRWTRREVHSASVFSSRSAPDRCLSTTADTTSVYTYPCDNTDPRQQWNLFRVLPTGEQIPMES
ncbi:ricin-type beta-trefoil lectin domain protein [Streptomyces microflavus]|uniref:Ricin-type beta-trefoil lectin domain protein n=1 Tax=Streptomyces microflavus TaxID=1919 RepID=A0A7H8N0B7_STRMI|nr:ricin-type beta-trefoil lectin domain protein [Streptomyces microflavus]QKW47915.1 ricin-type beta-trefoil lectin domain protein [Streptomyces microflavus]